jgi:hypothetical protein
LLLALQVVDMVGILQTAMVELQLLHPKEIMVELLELVALNHHHLIPLQAAAVALVLLVVMPQAVTLLLLAMAAQD